MALSKEEVQRLAELEELEALQGQYGSARGQAELGLASPESTGAINAGLSGAAQGATFGFSDELGAGVDVAGDVLSGKGIEGLGDKWRGYQKSREAANKQLSEEHPYAYLGGEVAGGLATTPLIPGLGGAKLIGAAGKLSPKVAAFLAAGKGASTSAKIAGKGTAAAIEGAPLGLAYGVGSSEADLSKPEELAADAASGLAMGSLGGLAIGGAVAGGQAAMEGAPKLLKKFDFTRKLGEAYDLGKEGVNFDTTAGKGQVAKMTQDIPNQITDEILVADKQLGEAVGASLANAEQAGVRINIDPTLEQSSQDLFKIFADNPILLQTVDPKSKALLVKASQSSLGDLTPIEARALKDTLFEMTDKLSGINSEVSVIAGQKGRSIASALDNAIKESIPEYRAAASKFAEFRSSIPEVALQPNLPSDKRTKMLGNLKNREAELYKGISSTFGKARLPGAPTVEGSRAGLEEMLANLQKINKSSPEAVKALGGTPEEVAGKWSKLSDRMAVLKQSQGIEPHEGIQRTALGTVVGSGEGVGYNIANKVGKIGQSGPVKVAGKLASIPHDRLMQLAQKLKTSNKASAFYGEALEKALLNKNESGKNAVLFKLLQIPEYREMLKSEGLADEQ